MSYDNDKRTLHEQAADKISKNSRDIKSILRRKMTAIHNALLSTADPQAVLDVFGDNAVQAITDHASMTAACNALGLTVPTLPDGAISINEDGTVSVQLPEPEVETTDA